MQEIMSEEDAENVHDESANLIYNTNAGRSSLFTAAAGIHPTVISDSLHKASVKAVDVLTAMAVPVELTDRDSLVRSASTSLNSIVVSQYSSLLVPLAVDSVLAVVDPVKPDLVDLSDVKIVKKLGGTVDDTELVKGLVFDKKVSHAAGGPTRVENAKIAVIQFQISPPKTDIEQIVVSDYTQMDRILKEERNYILSMIKKIKSTGCNVLLIQKSILRDAVADLSLHYLAKAKILVIKDFERDDIEFITKTLNCLPIANIEHFRAEKLGFADMVEEVSCGDGKIIKITGIKDMGRTTNVLVRGSNQLVLDEAERSLHDALCVLDGVCSPFSSSPGCHNSKAFAVRCKIFSHKHAQRGSKWWTALLIISIKTKRRTLCCAAR
ncbi:T-complex protein 1 subunit delta [Tanacetum coccineum]